MSKTMHSPGPWKNGIDSNGRLITFQHERVTGLDRDVEYQANRALADAAPELLEFAQIFLASRLSAMDIIELGQRAQKLIAKATGEAA